MKILNEFISKSLYFLKKIGVFFRFETIFLCHMHLKLTPFPKAFCKAFNTFIKQIIIRSQRLTYLLGRSGFGTSVHTRSTKMAHFSIIAFDFFVPFTHKREAYEKSLKTNANKCNFNSGFLEFFVCILRTMSSVVRKTFLFSLHKIRSRDAPDRLNPDHERSRFHYRSERAANRLGCEDKIQNPETIN